MFRRLRRDRRRLQLPLLGPDAVRPQHRQHGGDDARGGREARVLGDAARDQAAVRHARRLAADPAVLLVLPHRQRPPRERAGTQPPAVADRLGGGRRPTGAHLRRDPSQQRRVGAVQRDHHATRSSTPPPPHPAGTVARVAIPDAAGVAAVSLNLTTDDPRARRLPHRLRLRPAAAGDQQPQLRPRRRSSPTPRSCRSAPPARCASSPTPPPT